MGSPLFDRNLGVPDLLWVFSGFWLIPTVGKWRLPVLVVLALLGLIAFCGTNT